VWNPVGSGSVWSHVRETGLDALWSGADPNFTADASLVSPPVTAGTGPLSISFSHRYSFEFTPASGAVPPQAFDGGVIEFSTDGGATWQDVTLIANPGYNNTLVTGGTNPLAGRRAYSGTNPAFPASDSITMFFGTRLAGKTFQFRFRVGADSNGASTGWQVDDVQFKGIVGTPFPTLVPDTKHCRAVTGGGGGGGTGSGAGDPPPAGSTDGDRDHRHGEDDIDNGGCSVGGAVGAGNAGALLLALTVLLRRRRR
jgi:MYXO-CTERM domain-containing protein